VNNAIPANAEPWDDVQVSLYPVETVAPVGSEVVLAAGVGGPDGSLHTYRRLEWTISSGSVGQFNAVGKNGVLDWMMGDFNCPKKVSNTYAIGSTLRENVRLTRSTTNPESNPLILRGQGWVTVTSPIEGTSHVTVMAPEVNPPNARMKAAAIHWIDAQWRMPPPAINPAGAKHVMTTCVMRQTNQLPREGWVVRYQIVDGPEAGFSPDGVQVAEVATNAAGQASVEIFQKQPAPGTNRISVQIIQPGNLPGANGQRVAVGSGMAMETWTAADLGARICGPAVGSIGATLTYRIEISNPGDLPAKNVVVSQNTPPGLTFLNSNPQPGAASQQLQWALGEIGARQQRTIEVNFRADRTGCINNSCEATAEGGLKVTGCMTTTIGATPSPSSAPGAPSVAGPSNGNNTAPTPAAPSNAAPSNAAPSNATPTPSKPSPLEITITPNAKQATVGDQVTFEIQVINRGQTPVAKLVLKDRFDLGLDPPGVQDIQNNRSLETPLGDLAPGGKSSVIPVTFRVTKPGRLCHTVEVSGPNTATATRQACVTAVDPTGASGESIPPSTGRGSADPSATKPAGISSFSIKLAGPTQVMVVDETAQFTISVKNTGTVALRHLKVIDSFDSSLTPTRATEGYQWEGKDLAWTIDTLQPGKMNSFEILCKCNSPAVKACNRVNVSAEDKHATDESCFEIRIAGGGPISQNQLANPDTSTNSGTSNNPDAANPNAATNRQPDVQKQPPAADASAASSAPAGNELSITIPGTHNPIAINKGVVYRVQVANNGAKSCQQVTLTATFPQGLIPASIGTKGPGGTLFRPNLQNGTVVFDPVLEIHPGESLIYEIRGIARQSGQGQFHVELSSPDLPKPITQDVSAEVVQ
jgi:uncharacterized repeat protein (TIGR01451 family)